MVKYRVSSFSNNIIKFQFLDELNNPSEKFVEVNLSEFANGYRGITDSHYFDTKNNSIVLLGYPNNRRLIVIDDGILYRKAIQSEYDEYEYEHFPNSDNSKMYKYLKSR